MKFLLDPIGLTGQTMLGRRKIILAMTGTLCLGGLSVAGVSGMLSSRKIKPPTNPIPRDYFGLHIHRADTTTPWPGVRFGSWRLWDAYANWPHLEPRRGQWNFSRLDKYLAMAALTGVNVLLPLGLSPAWASARPDEPSAYKPGNAAEPLNIADWRNYVRTVAERYKGRIHYYELWNEPNLRNFYTGSVEAMVQLAREAYTILKQVDNQNQLAAPATTEGGRQLEWLDRYLALGGGEFMDVLSHHFYVPRVAPEQMLPVMDDIRRIMAKYGMANKPVWNTETGWWQVRQHATSSTFTTWKKLAPDEAAAYVSRALILGWASGMKRLYWYSWESANMGLVDAGNYALNSAGIAFAKTQGWLEGAVMTECTASQGRWMCTLKRGAEGLARIVWLDAPGTAAWEIPAEWLIKEVESLDGMRKPLSFGSATIELGEGPVLLRG